MRTPFTRSVSVQAAAARRPAVSPASLAALALMILSLFILNACSLIEAEGSAANHRLRIENRSEVPLTGLVVLFPEDRIEFGDIPAGETSEYKDVPNGVYNYAAYEVQIDGETYQQPVIDWVGETPREGKDFTYVLDFDPARAGQEFLVIELVEVRAD